MPSISSELIQDSAQSFLTLTGSDVDPTEGIFYSKCKPDAWQWYEQGGIASKIIEFWPRQETTGLTINVATAKGSAAAKGRSQQVKDWLEKEFKRLNLLQVLYDAELQCQLDRAAPILVYTDGNESISSAPKYFDKIERLEVLDYTVLNPVMPNANMQWGEMAKIDHAFVSRYDIGQTFNQFVSAGTGSVERIKSVSPERLLVLQGKKRIASDRKVSDGTRIWGDPMIGAAVVEAAQKLDLAIAAAGILIQKKNTMIIMAANLLDAVQKMANGDDAAATDLAKIVKIFTKGGNIQNVQLLDKEEMDAKYIERSLGGVAEVIQKLKDQLLAHCYLIPETFLFGMQQRGGLSQSNDYREQVDTTADLFFNNRLLPLIEKLVKLMLLGSECPVKGFDVSAISITRNPAYSKSDQEKAAIRLTTVQADKIMVDMQALTAKEVRSRETGAGYQLGLNLDSEPPEKPQTN